MKSKLKAPGTKRLKLKYVVWLSSFALSFNLRRYNLAAIWAEAAARLTVTECVSTVYRQP
jgi:hypothetical protein